MANELAKQSTVPAYMQSVDANTGVEDIGGADVSMPFLAIGQGLTPLVMEGALTMGDIFNTIDGTILAKAGEPLIIHPVLHWVNYIQWGDRDSQEGMLDMQGPGGEAERSVKLREKKEDKPDEYIWTMYHNYIVVPEVTNPDVWFVLGCCRSNIKSARRFNMMLKRRNAPIYSTRYNVCTKLTKNRKGQFFTYEFTWVDNNGWVSEDEFNVLREMHEQFKELKDSIAAAIPQPDDEEVVDGEDKF